MASISKRTDGKVASPLPRRRWEGTRSPLRSQSRCSAMAGRGDGLRCHGAVRRPRRRQNHIRGLLSPVGLAAGLGLRDAPCHGHHHGIDDVCASSAAFDPALPHRTVGEGHGATRPRPFHHSHPSQQRESRSPWSRCGQGHPDGSFDGSGASSSAAARGRDGRSYGRRSPPGPRLC